MEIFIYLGIALIVIAAVALPFVHGSRGAADAREFATEPLAAAPDSPGSLGLEGAVPVSNDALEADIARYREAVAAGTVCGRCGEANPRDAKFCADCGRPLVRAADADAQEYA